MPRSGMRTPGSANRRISGSNEDTALTQPKGQDEDHLSNIKVFIRLRPPEGQQEVSTETFKFKNESITLSNPRRPHSESFTFGFNEVFGPTTSQEQLFEQSTIPLVAKCLEGYNSCCVAYGQTGSGKTHTMFGSDDHVGIIPRATRHIFDTLEERAGMVEYGVVVSFLEIYCDQIRDLGKAYNNGTDASTARSTTSEWYKQGKVRSSFSYTQSKSVATDYADENLSIHEDNDGNVFVKGLSIIPVEGPQQVLEVLEAGFRLRATHETKLNSVSSRSHTVFTIHVIQKDLLTHEVTTGMLNMVDLAGSERLSKSDSEGQRLSEAQSINSSLAALGKVVMTLYNANGKDNIHIPYRDSKLTRILQNSLGGNSYTSFLATIHPREQDCEESLSTLQFAHCCKSVTTRPTVNVLSSKADRAEKLKELKEKASKSQEECTVTRIVSDMRLMKLLLDLGIDGKLLKDGRVLLQSGEIIGISHCEARDSAYCRKCTRSLIKATIAQKNIALGEKTPATSVCQDGEDGLMRAMFPQEVDQFRDRHPDKTVTRSTDNTTSTFPHHQVSFRGPEPSEDGSGTAQLRNTVDRLKKELKLTKEQLKQQEASSAAEIGHLRRQTITSRETIRKISRESFQSTEELRKKCEDFESTHNDNVQKIMDHSRDLLQSRSNLSDPIPEYLERERAQQNQIDSLSQTLDQRDNDKKVEELKRELAIVKMQKDSLEHRFSCYRNEADLDKHKTREELKQSERMRREQAATLQQELRSLFKYTQKISELLTRCIDGEFPMRFRGTSYRINIPREVVPRDPLGPTKQDQKPFQALRDLVRSIDRDNVVLFNRSKIKTDNQSTASSEERGHSVRSSERESSMTQEECKTASSTERSDEVAKYQRKLREASLRENNLRISMNSQQRLFQKQLEKAEQRDSTLSRSSSLGRTKPLTSPLRPSLTAADAVRQASEAAGLKYQ